MTPVTVSDQSVVAVVGFDEPDGERAAVGFGGGVEPRRRAGTVACSRSAGHGSPRDRRHRRRLGDRAQRGGSGHGEPTPVRVRRGLRRSALGSRLPRRLVGDGEPGHRISSTCGVRRPAVSATERERGRGRRSPHGRPAAHRRGCVRRPGSRRAAGHADRRQGARDVGRGLGTCSASWSPATPRSPSSGPRSSSPMARPPS